jgi:hypothetical protein
MFVFHRNSVFLQADREQYGNIKANVPNNVPNYFYKRNTGSDNLRLHLRRCHGNEYDKAIEENKWNYKTSEEMKTKGSSTGTQNTRTVCKNSILTFSSTTFLDYLVRFIVADDQVSEFE